MFLLRLFFEQYVLEESPIIDKILFPRKYIKTTQNKYLPYKAVDINRILILKLDFM